jgi:hypothetical protein
MLNSPLNLDFKARHGTMNHFQKTIGATMKVLEIVQIEDGLGVILPEEILTRLNRGAGDTVYLSYGPNTGITLTPRDPDLEGQVDAGREFMQEHRETFRKLAD